MGELETGNMGCEASRIEELEERMKTQEAELIKYQVRLEEQQKELEASNRQSELVTMFRAMDKNNNGTISVDELKQVSYFLATNVKFEELLKQADLELPQDLFVQFWLEQARTDDGKFGNWEPVRTQALHIMQEQDANAPTEEDGDVKKQTQFLETVYNVIDLDGDGALTKLELQAACNAATNHSVWLELHLITGQDLFERLLDFISKQILASLQSLPEPEASADEAPASTGEAPASTGEAPASTCEAPASTGEASLGITSQQWVKFWMTQVETCGWAAIKSDVRKLQLSQMQVQCGKEFVKGAGTVQAVFEAQQYKNGEAVFEKIDKNNDGKLSLEEVKAWAEDKDNTKEAQKFFYRWVETDGEQVRETDGQHFFAELQQCVFKCGAGTNYSAESTDPALLKRALTEGGTNYEMTKTVFATKYASVIKTRAGKNQKQFTSALIKA